MDCAWSPVSLAAQTTNMTLPNKYGTLSRLAFALPLLLPSVSCGSGSDDHTDPEGEIASGFSLVGILIVDPGTDYEVGDEVIFGSNLLTPSGTGAGALVSEVDAGGGVSAIEINDVGHGYQIAPTAYITSEEGKGCVLLPDLRIVEICLDNEVETNLNGTMHISVPALFGEAGLELPIIAVLFSELGSDQCFMAVNGTLALGKTSEFEVTVFTSTLDEFVEGTDHIIKNGDEGMILVHKIDLDGDGEYEIAEGEINFHIALGGAIALTSATIDMESNSFASGISGVFDGSIGVTGTIDFTDCD